MRELVDKYAWAEDGDLVCTVAVVSGCSTHNLVAAYGGTDTEPVRLTHDEAWVPQQDFGHYFHVQVLSEGASTVAIEPNGWTGSLPEIARRASAGGRFVSAFWSMSGARRITEAEHGRVRAWFNPFMIAAPGSAGDLVPGWIETAEFDIDRPNASCLAAIELRTGVAPRQEWFSTPQDTYRIPDPDEFLRNVPDARRP